MRATRFHRRVVQYSEYTGSDDKAKRRRRGDGRVIRSWSEKGEGRREVDEEVVDGIGREMKRGEHTRKGEGAEQEENEKKLRGEMEKVWPPEATLDCPGVKSRRKCRNDDELVYIQYSIIQYEYSTVCIAQLLLLQYCTRTVRRAAAADS